MPEEEFQKERFALQEREYKYYRTTYRDLPALPDLTDQTGGLSNPAYFNFVVYVAWKVAARRLTDPKQRQAFVEAAGAALLDQAWPDAVAEARAAAARGPSGRATEADVVALLGSALEVLRRGGYCCGWQLTWGELPGGWPADWAVSQPRVAGEPPLAGAAAPSGLQFQLKLLYPADIAASVALRAEEEAFSGQSVASMLRALLAGAGYGAEADEYYYQDSWQDPEGLFDQVLLKLGDPLEQVQVPWTPTTLVQDWRLTQSSTARVA